MSCIVGKTREGNHTREEYISVRNLFSVLFKNFFKKYLLLKFPIYELKRF